MKPELFIITVMKDCLSVLNDMLDSLFMTFGIAVSFKLIIIDNCSTDKTMEYVKSNYPSESLIENNICHRSL
jgi:glycosyltransferase involved in cell wall biosynthesis